jgi:predicted Zn-dependent peptidase
MFEKHTFKNNLRLITAPLSGTKAFTLLVLVGAGSRYETEEERGLAHFQEHMFFKGAKKYDTPSKVLKTIDSVGGDCNAFTGKEYVGYYMKASSDKKELAFDILSDSLLHAKFDTKEIDKERGVIIEEMNMYEDMPIYKIGWDFEALMFGDHPMGKDQIGTKNFINNVQTKDFLYYKKKLYTSDNIVIIASGDISAIESKNLTEKYFTFENSKKQKESPKFNWDELSNEKIFIRNKKTEQAQLVIGYPAFSRDSEYKYTQQLLSIILGGNMSSRMFSSIREEKGLCYTISSSVDLYKDCATFSTSAGVSIPKIHEAIKSINNEYNKLCIDKISNEELDRAKNYFKGKLTLSFEDSEEVASFYGTQALLSDNILTQEEFFDKIDKIRVDDIFIVAKKLFKKDKRRMSIIGPFEGEEESLKETFLLN